MEVNDRVLKRAAKELRIRLNLTQQAFGDRIGRTVPSILRYETQVAPRGQALIPYALLAIENEFSDLADLFRDAILQENGPALQKVMNWNAKANAPKARSTAVKTAKVNADVAAFMNSSVERQHLVEGLCALMSADELPPIEELARETIKQVLLERRKAGLPKKLA